MLGSQKALIFLIAIVTCSFPVAGGNQYARDPNTLNSFANWRIDLVRENKSLQLVGIVTEVAGARGAFIAIQCYSEVPWLMIQVPIFDTNEKEAARKRGYVQITAWNDQGKTETLPLALTGGLFGVAVADKNLLAQSDTSATSAFALLDKLQSAHSFFAFEAGGPTRTYDTKHFKAAREKFDQSCGEIRRSWEDFLKRL